MAIRLLLFLGAFSALGGCCSDDEERPPWERDGGGAATLRDGSAERTALDAGPPFAAVRGHVDLESSRATIELGGARVTPGGLVRAWLEADLDGDGDEDAVVLSAQPPADLEAVPTVELLQYRRDEGELVATGGLPLGPGPIHEVALRLDAPGAVTLTLTTLPPSAPRLEPPSPAPEGHEEPARPMTLAALLTGPFPLAVRASARLEGGAASIAMGARDQDGDGRPDAVLGIERAGARAEVVWLDRTAGPSIDPGATERSLAALVPPPTGRKRLDASVPRARAVVELRRLLCTGDLDGTRLLLLDRAARQCRSSRATGQAIAVLVRAHAHAGRVPDAREALGLLQMEGVSLGEQGRAALEELVADKTTLALEGTLVAGPRVPPGTTGDGPAVRFLDDDRVWVDATPPFVYYVSSAQVQPAEPLPSPTAPTVPAAASPSGHPEARAAVGTRRAVGAEAGLWIVQADRWALLPAARFGGSWQNVASLALSPSGETVATVRDGRLEIVTLRQPAAAPLLVEDPSPGQVRDGGGRDAATAGRGP